MNNIDPEEAKRYLDEQDKTYGLNTIVEESIEKQEPVKATSLGKIQSHQDQLELSAAVESPWKILSFDTLPSGGLFYPKDSEILLRSAKTKEIRHWSTIDEFDPIDVREKINFILSSCTKFKVRGNPMPLNYNDFLEIDKYHILFRIHELTFPNQENKLFAQIKCSNTQCGHITSTQVMSKNLVGYKYPNELMKWYSEEERCFIVPSEKLGETLRFYMPTIGMLSKFRQKKKADQQNGISIDEAFYKHGKFLLPNWKQVNLETLGELKVQSNSWNDNKFLVIHKFTESLSKDELNKVASVCEKCKTQTESHIFLGGSFTVKDIFIISAGLDELI